MQNTEQIRALNRFGLGARPGEALQLDPKPWLRAQITTSATEIRGSNLKTTQQLVEEIASMRRKRMSNASRKDFRKQATKQLEAEVTAAVNHGLRTDAPFAERLVRFWSNHFTVSGEGEKEVRYLAGAYEREAIRPNVFGKFADMVLASARHPAMLIYLDQVRSVGPNSKIGKRRSAGLNENYARELMELHTLGVDGGYDQSDVEALAKILTGWTIGGFGRKSSRPITPFNFEASIHEPGSKTLLGRKISENGEKEGREAIKLLVRHPSTAKFVATKLVQHFVADLPPKDDVDKIAKVFQDTDGDLAQVSMALIDLRSAFTTEARKFRPPQEYILAVARALQLREVPVKFLSSLRPMRHPYWGAMSPAGYKDTAQAWADPDALVKRTALARQIADTAQLSLSDISAQAPQIIEAHDPAGLTNALSSQANSKDALALFFASPDFQWR